MGSKYCHAEDLYEFLKQYKRLDYLFLIGDIIDGWQLKRRWYWNNTYNFILRKILSLSKHGTKVVYIAGNHDEFMDHYLHLNDFGNILVTDEYKHTLADGREALLMHGDQFDYITRHIRWLSLLGDIGYNFCLWANSFINFFRRRVGIRSHWSFSALVKKQVKRAANYINDFENLITKHAKQEGCDMIICGHIHTPKTKEINGVEYWNCGDWMESNTAIIEDEEGNLSLVSYRKQEEQQLLQVA